MEKKVEEEQAERLKMGQNEDDDKAKKEISSVNPITDFKAMINDRKVDRVGDAITQMQKMIERFISTALKGDLFGKAIDCLKELRRACMAEDEAPSFNRFAYRIRNNFSKGDEQSNFFLRVIAEGITLITKHESKLSSLVEQQEANEFLEFDEDLRHAANNAKAKEAKGTGDDLLDDIE